MKIGSPAFRRSIETSWRALSYSPWTPWGPSLLDPEAFAGKRVIIVGPAQTVREDLKSTDVDGYDIVVRLNNGLSLLQRDPDVMGRRTDLLFHNSRETGPRSAGRIPATVLKKHGVDTLVFPSMRRSQQRKAYRQESRELRRAGGPLLKLIPPRLMQGMRHAIEDIPPSVGATAILFFLDARLAELAIHGFTFFETAYAPGYNDAIQTAEDARGWVDAVGAHEPVSEKDAIRIRLDAALPHKIVLGNGVRRHLYPD